MKLYAATLFEPRRLHMLVGRVLGMRVRRLRQLFTLERRNRRLVAVNKTFENMSGRIVYIWPALDVDTGEILAAYASRGQVYA